MRLFAKSDCDPVSAAEAGAGSLPGANDILGMFSVVKLDFIKRYFTSALLHPWRPKAAHKYAIANPPYKMSKRTCAKVRSKMPRQWLAL